jgi:hypothetical protein
MDEETQKYVDLKRKLWHNMALIMYPELFVKITSFEHLYAHKICVQFKKLRIFKRTCFLTSREKHILKEVLVIQRVHIQVFWSMQFVDR